jgi:beta-phosphoglucomutase-like phosphatase (HAD superfamily)
MPIQGLIFDMDGTMIDSMPCHARSWVRFAERHGIQVEVEDLLRRTTGRTGAECMEILFGRAIDPQECAQLVHEKEQIYRVLFSPVFTEVAGFKAFSADAIGRGLRVGVGTAGDKHNIAFAFSHLRMEPMPHAVVGGDEGLAGKPEPAIFLEAARRIGVPPETCIVFEDAPLGIEAARRAGMRAVAVCTTQSAAQLAGPHVVASVRDYRELIESNFLGNLHAIPP